MTSLVSTHPHKLAPSTTKSATAIHKNANSNSMISEPTTQAQTSRPLTTTRNGSVVCTYSPPEAYFYPILPFAFEKKITPANISEWQTTIGPLADGMISIVRDKEIKENVVKITADAGNPKEVMFSFPSNKDFIGTNFRFLHLHLLSLDRFVEFEIEIRTKSFSPVTTMMSHETRTIRFTNHTGVVRVTCESAILPLELVPGWNELTIDLQRFAQLLWQERYLTTSRIRIYASCCLRRIFFAKASGFSNDDLPPSLRLPTKLRNQSTESSSNLDEIKPSLSPELESK